ncbi:MAG: 1-deoxy-D-xylulose-5-phosphate synthase [Ruminococcaceae bacterium]|nr:1-deoxy-D-xylulose-5-phosphate synthase [Oscillospiraceae bacterium]
MYKLLTKVQSPADLKEMPMEALDALSREIRTFLVENIPKTGGHLASNLGVVELTLALHRTFSVPRDKLIWDVGHQSYVHKLLTGRREKFTSLRQFGGLSGFPKCSESVYDCADTGHSSTAISTALGYAAARDLQGGEGESIAVVGDASFSGGLSMEALNHIAHCNHKVIVVLNDNQMSIGQVVGGFSQYLNKIRTRSSYYTVKRETSDFLHRIPFLGKPTVHVIKKIKRFLRYCVTPGVVFEKLGCRYLGPVDGHNIRQLCDTFSEAARIPQSVLVHVITTKGKGYPPAEEAPSRFHAVSPAGSTAESCSARFGKTVLDLGQTHERLVAISPSTPDASGLGAFMEKFPARFFDTGIAEAHAATFAAGLARGGLIPVLSVYSSFLQRAYDSLVHDIALSNLHVVLAVDRAGLVGRDGETHQGIFDLSFLTHIPNMAVLAPSDLHTLEEMLRYAVEKHTGPIAVRYPRGNMPPLSGPPFVYGKAAILRTGQHITLVTQGRMTHTALAAADLLAEKGISATVLDLRTAKPMDKDTVLEAARKTGAVITLEDNTAPGGIGQQLAAMLAGIGCRILTRAFPDTFIQQGTVEELMALYKMDAQSLAADAERMLKA